MPAYMPAYMSTHMLASLYAIYVNLYASLYVLKQCDKYQIRDDSTDYKLSIVFYSERYPWGPRPRPQNVVATSTRPFL
jgi:hypothetical protein